MPLRTCICNQNAHAEDASVRSKSSKPGLGAALIFPLAACSLLIVPQRLTAQVNGVGQRPYLGWSTFSEQTINSSFANTVTFNNVYAPRDGEYLMQVDSMTIGLRSYLYKVNNGPFQTLNCSGGSFLLPASTIVPVHLKKGLNAIQFGNPPSYPPDLDRIVISGNGDFPPPTSATYEAEVATLSGSATAEFSNYSSGLAKVGNLGGSAANSVTFSNVTVPADGTYQLEIDYQTSGLRSCFLSVNGGAAQELDLNGTTFNDPVPVVVPVQLHAGVNTINIGNPSGYAPDLDRIVVAATTSFLR